MDKKDICMPQSYIELIEKRYKLKVIDSHYILVDEKYQRYNMMLNVQFNNEMRKAFEAKYGNDTSKNHVAWEVRESTDSICFYAQVGNNILLLWDSLID